MCSIEEPVMIKDSDPSNACVKCQAPSVTCIRQTSYCEKCFLTNFSHKFRMATKHREPCKILVAFSGGSSSRALLHECLQAFRNEPRRKNLDNFIVGHVFKTFSKNEQEIKRFCSEYNLKLLQYNLDDIIMEDKRILGFHTQNAENDFIGLARNKALILLAKQEDCQMIYFGDSSTKIAVSILASTAKGRGFALPFNVQANQTIQDICIMRPLREHSLEEIKFYCKIHNLEFLDVNDSKCETIDQITLKFIQDLEQGFSSTVNTVIKSADKLVKPVYKRVCPRCLDPMQEGIETWRNQVCLYSLDKELKEENPSLCYGCQVLDSETKFQ